MVFNATAEGVPLGILLTAVQTKNQTNASRSSSKKCDNLCIRLSIIPAADRHTDGHWLRIRAFVASVFKIRKISRILRNFCKKNRKNSFYNITSNYNVFEFAQH